MGRTRAWLSATLTALVAVFTIGVSGMAWAHHRSDHAGGNPKPGVMTEDTDGDGVGNAPDPQGDSDNRHPSGKDRHEEGGSSGNQGNSSSEPDANGKGPERDEGGLDKPDGPGGLDILDQDGNNGCGNDDDFEDDNEGLCLGRQKDKPETETGAEGETEADVEGEAPAEIAVIEGASTEETTEVAPVESATIDAEVLGEVIQAEVLGELIEAAGVDQEVLGSVVRSSGGNAPVVAGVPLAFTGANALMLLGIALGLGTVGLALVMIGRRRAAA